MAKALGNVLEDSSAMYYNKGDEISKKYGMDEKEVMSIWWGVLNKTVKEFQKAGKVEQADDTRGDEEGNRTGIQLLQDRASEGIG